MTDAAMLILLAFAILSCGLLAGVYFAFSAFIMTALDRTGTTVAVAAMTSINRVILRSWFMPLFFGSSLASLALAIVAAFRWSDDAAPPMLTGALIYLFGMFGVTMLFNVPRNNDLAASDSATAAGEAAWSRYLDEWTRWNHVRTLACVVATGLFVVALVLALSRYGTS